jgi:ribosomal protein L11 methyltransferase
VLDAAGSAAAGRGALGGCELVIDPGDTFGLGGHPTTRLCLELLLEREPAGALCDWGTGSGVLAVAAARLGWGPVLAVDDDAAAVAAARMNARANGVDVDVRRLDLVAAPDPPSDPTAVDDAAHDLAPADHAPWAPAVCANLPFDLHQRLAAGPLPRPPHLLIASGILASRADATAAAWAAHGLAKTARRTADGWAALTLERT